MKRCCLPPAVGSGAPARLTPHAPTPPSLPDQKNQKKQPQGGGGGGLPNPFDMGKLMESVKKAQQMVQVETARVQKELDELSLSMASRVDAAWAFDAPQPLTTPLPSPPTHPHHPNTNRTDFEGYDEDETVRVVLTGNQAPKLVEVTAEAMAAGEEELSARLTAAMKDAHGKSVAGMREKMKGLAASLGLPAGGMGGMPGM